MSIPPYTPNIPTVNQSLGNSRQAVVNNFANAFQTFAVEHVNGNSSSNPGYHNFVHLLRQTALTVGSNMLVLFSASSSERSALKYARDSSGTSFQITGPDPITANPGSTQLIGGMNMQFGTVITNPSSGSTRTVVFPNAYSSTPYSVVVSPIKDSGVTTSNYIYVVSSSITNSQFKVGFGGGDIQGFTWIAIGPLT